MTQTMHRRHLMLTTLAALAVAACSPAAPPEWQVSLDEARQLLERGDAVVFDIREADEHADGVAQGMRLLPVSQLDKRLAEIPKDPAQPVLIICATQSRSSTVVRALREAGWTHVRYVDGGMVGWVRRGWPVFKPMG
jgi:rhodanese-related sulfurtransferase